MNLTLRPWHKLAFFYNKKGTKRTARALCPDHPYAQVCDLLGTDYPENVGTYHDPKSVNWDNVNCATCLSLREVEDTLTRKPKDQTWNSPLFE